MTSFQPDLQGTGPTYTSPATTATIVLEFIARHRTETTTVTPPVWFLLAMTGTAFGAGVVAWVCHSLPLMLLALMYAVVAFAVDVHAAIKARKDGADR